ncbi:MAG TPA: magnesium transporter CorA family protein [Clostridia bacterium]
MFVKYGSKRLKKMNVPKTQVREIVHGNLIWIDIIKPVKSDIEKIGSRFNLHELPLEDCLTEHQRSKIDDFGDYCFIVLHLPRYKKDIISLESEEIDIFLGHNYLITIHEGELKPLVNLSDLCCSSDDARLENMSEGPAILLYEIIKSLFDYCFPMLDKIQINLSEINRNIFNDTSKTMLEYISRTKMQIINYRKVIKPLRPVILSLENVIKKFLAKDLEIYFDDITDKAEKIWDMLENHKEVIESIDTTFSSLTNQKNNSLMAIFTVIQVIILPMVLVGGLFSMNVEGIPMHQNTGAFWIVFGMIMVPTIIIALLIYINKKKFF